jgi:hypothetical protein
MEKEGKWKKGMGGREEEEGKSRKGKGELRMEGKGGWLRALIAFDNMSAPTPSLQRLLVLVSICWENYYIEKMLDISEKEPLNHHYPTL